MNKVKVTRADRIEAIDCIVLIEIIEKYPRLFYIVSSKKQEDLCIRYPYKIELRNGQICRVVCFEI